MSDTERDVTEKAMMVRNELLELTGCTSGVECNLYRGNAPTYDISAGINGWKAWTPEAAEQFVSDVRDAASAELENHWWKALQRTGVEQ